MPDKTEGEHDERSEPGNRLIDSLPCQQRTAVLAHCERIELQADTSLFETGQPFAYAYFPVTGTVSLIRELADHQPFETERVGREGMLARPLILGINRAPQRGLVQSSCVALRMEASKLRAAMDTCAEFSLVLQHYLYAVIEELSQSKGCVHFHDVGKRLARGLLVARYRARNDNLAITHQTLASMLGVQRGAVTIAAIKLQREGIIRYSRGKITILDQKALEAASCGCFSASLEGRSRIPVLPRHS